MVIRTISIMVLDTSLEEEGEGREGREGRGERGGEGRGGRGGGGGGGGERSSSPVFSQYDSQQGGCEEDDRPWMPCTGLP